MPNKKWILFINPSIYPCNIGGIEIFNFYLLKELSRKNKIHQLTFCNDFEKEDNIVRHVFKRPIFIKASVPLLIFFFIMKYRKSIKLIHLSYARAYWTHWFIYVITKKVFGIKYMITIHGGGLSEWKPEFPYKIFFKNAEVITGVSDIIIEEYSKRSDKEIIFTPPLIPFEVILPKNKYREKWLVDSDDKVLLYVGSLKPLKSVDTLIEALGIITNKELEELRVKVLIVGDGVSRDTLESRVAELNLQNNVRFLGNIERETVNQLYNIANFYTICSEFEGLPISLLEAFANELPCITSDAPGLKEVSLNKNTLLFATKDAHDYAQKIQILLKDIDLQIKLKKNAGDFFRRNFSYGDLVGRFEEILNKIE